MAELYWSDRSDSLRVRGHHAFEDDAYLGGIAERKDNTFTCLIAGSLSSDIHPCEHVTHSSPAAAREALEAAVWVLLVGYTGENYRDKRNSYRTSDD